MPTAIKPSASFYAKFNTLKKNGLTVTEAKVLLSKADQEIKTSKDPIKLGNAFQKEVRGWAAKGLSDYGTRDMGEMFISASVDKRVTKDAVSYLKANGAALASKHPSLKNVDFKSLKVMSAYESCFIVVKNKQGETLSETRPESKLLQKLLASAVPSAKHVPVGVPKFILE